MQNVMEESKESQIGEISGINILLDDIIQIIWPCLFRL